MELSLKRMRPEEKPFSSSILADAPAFLLLAAFLIFWVRAVDFHPAPFNLALLCVGLWVNIPLVLAISPRGLACLKAGFASPYGYPLFGAYLVLTAFQCAVLIAFRLHSGAPLTGDLQVVLPLLAYYLWFPLCALGMSWLLFRRPDMSGWKPVLYLGIMIPVFKAGERYVYEILVKTTVLSRYHELALLKFKIEGHPYYLELNEIWALLIPALLLLMGALSHEKVRLQAPWNRRILLIGLFFAAFFLVRNLVFLHVGKLSLATSNWGWNLATGFYSQAARPALLEELAFRGILQTWLSGKLSNVRGGEFFAILIPALLFGAYHYPFIGTTWYHAAVVGLLFGWAYSKTRNLWVPIGLHGFNNIMNHAIFV